MQIMQALGNAQSVVFNLDYRHRQSNAVLLSATLVCSALCRCQI